MDAHIRHSALDAELTSLEEKWDQLRRDLEPLFKQCNAAKD